jgi:hypothetical protein
LTDHEEEQGCGGDGVNVFGVELPAAVQVAEGIAKDGEGGTDDL